MDIKYFNTYNESIVQDIYTLSKLMEDGGEQKRFVFVTTYQLIKLEKATFFIVYKKKKKIAFGLLHHGTQDENFRKLTYFAVKKNYRGKGLGSQVMKEVIKSEVNLNSGCFVACKSTLNRFYEKFNFKLSNDMKIANNNTDYDFNIMILSSSVPTKITSMIYIIEIVEPTIYPYYKQLEKTYDISLMPK